MGFLYGTVFAVFYAVFGLPLARFADVWVRRSLISGGLLFWSAMTVFSGLSRSFPVLALCCPVQDGSWHRGGQCFTRCFFHAL